MYVFLNIFMVLCMFIMGSLFGSFFSLATYRIPRKQDIIATRSYCPNCKHRLEFFDLIPVLSYLFHGAKCKYCKEPISPRYFLLETINGIFFVILYLLIGYNLKLALVILIYAVLFVVIGAKVMKSKMTESEIKEVEKMKEEKNNKKEKNCNKKLSKKSGVFISEIIVAFVLFILTFVTIIVVNKNTRNMVRENILRTNANDILIKNVELCNLAKYDDVKSYTNTVSLSTKEDVVGDRKKDATSYTVSVDVKKLSDLDSTKEDVVKVVNVKVEYMLGSEKKSVTMETLKGKV